MLSKHSHFLPISLFSLLYLISLAHAECYVAAYGLVGKQSGWVACAGTAKSGSDIETCCMPGSECGEDSLCHIPSSSNPGNNSWYQAGCTDSSYQDPVCRNSCEDYTQTYINYDDTTDLWMCCGDGGCNGTVTGDTFKAVSPSKWQVITGESSSSSTSSPATATSRNHNPTSADFKPTPTSQTGKDTAGSSSNNSNGLSAGATAAMAVTISVAFLALIAALVAIHMLRRNRKEKEMIEEKIMPANPAPPPPPYPIPTQASHGSRFSEAPTESAYSELPVHEPVHELAGAPSYAGPK